MAAMRRLLVALTKKEARPLFQLQSSINFRRAMGEPSPDGLLQSSPSLPSFFSCRSFSSQSSIASEHPPIEKVVGRITGKLEGPSANSGLSEVQSSRRTEAQLEALTRLAAGGKTAQRFFKAASVEPAFNGGGYVVKLDKHVLKTPAKKQMKLPSENLAYAIAAEWEWQEGRELRPFTMPLMKLATIAIDQIPSDRSHVIQLLLKYFHTDSLLCRAPPGSVLAGKQADIWDPILDMVAELTGVRPLPTADLFVGDQSSAAVKAMEKQLQAADDWQLSAIDSLAGSARSLTVGLAVSSGMLSVKDAVTAVRLEEDFQVEDWGFVEGGHDVDIADLQIRLAAPSLFLRLLETQ